MEMDWQINKSVLQCNKYLLENSLNCDVRFKVGEDQEIIEAHKLILSTRSPVFDRMFNGSFNESETDPVIPDVSPSAFRALLRYCYYDCLEIDGEAALSLLYAATKYMLPILEGAARTTLILKLDNSKIWDVCKYSTDVGDDELHEGCIEYLKGHLSSLTILDVLKYSVSTGEKELKDYCRKHLQENLSETNILDVTMYISTIGDKRLNATCKNSLKEHLSRANIWQVYKYAHDGNDEKVLQYCREYFEKDAATVTEALESKDFLNIQYELLLDVMHINDKVKDASGSGHNLGINISEIELFKACNKWAEGECLRQKIEPTGINKRNALGQCLSLIRFPTMLQKDLVTIVYPTGILTEAGIGKLGQYIYRDPGSHCQVDFPTERREFTVRLLDHPTNISNKSTVYIQSEHRLLLTRMWVKYKGRHTVTVRDENSGRLWSMSYDTKHRNHVSGNILDPVLSFFRFASGGHDDVLQYIDIEPQVLEANTRFSISVEWKVNSKSMVRVPNEEYTVLKERHSGYNGVKVSRDGNTYRGIHALTLSLV